MRDRTRGEDGRVRPTPLTTFERERPRLLGICYRILSSVADAEDVLQETWLRWDGVDVEQVENDQAYLTTIATRLALDRLRRVKAEREVYPGDWLPEPVVAQGTADRGDPAAAVELADTLSMAMLVVLETLSPLERAAFVLREVFQRPYPEVAAVLGRSEPAVRQLVRRAREHVDTGQPRFRPDQATHAEVVRRFLVACQSADVDHLMEVLAPDVVLVSDAGGLAKAPRRAVNGSSKVARLLAGISPQMVPGTQLSLESFNGAVGLVARINGVPAAAMAVVSAGESIQSLLLIVNPEKLRALELGREVAIR